jgi:hypothetical protein
VGDPVQQMSDLQVPVHGGSSKVQVSVSKASRLVRGLAADGKGRRLRRRQYLEFRGLNLDISGCQAWVLRPLWTSLHPSMDADAKLGPKLFGEAMSIRCDVRVERDLHAAFSVSEIDEDEPAMVPATIYPSVEVKLYPSIFCAE